MTVSKGRGWRDRRALEDPPGGVGADHHDRRYRRHAASSSRSCCGATTRSGAGCSSSCSSCSGVGTAADYVNTQFAYFDNVATCSDIPTYPTVDGNASGPDVQQQPNGAVTQITVADTASQFGNFDAKVWLPPQYFSDPRAHFPVLLLLHGNPGANNDWLERRPAAETGLAAAQSGKPVILVMPDGAAERRDRRQPLHRHRVAGQRRDLPRSRTSSRRRHPAPHHGRREAPRHRRPVDGRVLRPQPRAQASRRVLGRRSTSPARPTPVADTLPGGLQQLFGAELAAAGRRQQTRRSTGHQLDGSKGPAIWMDCGTGDTAILRQMQTLRATAEVEGLHRRGPHAPRRSRLRDLGAAP